MKKYFIASVVSLFGILIMALPVHAKTAGYTQKIKGALPVFTDTIQRNNVSLIFINQYNGFADSVKEKMIDVFFKVYPEEMSLYNPQASKVVTFIIDTAYTGVAATSDDVVHFNPKWFDQHPQDIDVVTHEAMHIVQAYPDNPDAPWWITEGIADYVRLTLGVYNKEAGWAVPDYTASQSYSNSYRITARFFFWLEKHKKSGIVKSLDKAMRLKTYSNNFWKQETGESIKALWQDYSQHPSI